MFPMMNKYFHSKGKLILSSDKGLRLRGQYQGAKASEKKKKNNLAL